MNSKGFVFLELIVTVIIVGILAAVAIPAYTDYIVRSQVAESVSLTLTVKKAIGDYYAYHGRFPANNQAAGVSEQISGNYVSRVDVINGVIQVTFGHRSSEEIAGQTLSFQPVVTGHSLVGIVKWTCSYTMGDGYLPSSFRK